MAKEVRLPFDAALPYFPHSGFTLSPSFYFVSRQLNGHINTDIQLLLSFHMPLRKLGENNELMQS
ncbi:hypothetical protein OUZ56_027598 [Daphnia magna]|uniref:Uncharacterized protein n=1 Tax=Daphnia magna TaxID=35525 RepID=A0ABR0B1D3_9CRUS|nr:hypothetical protein OUZ56_027598 [Daphnia magna]